MKNNKSQGSATGSASGGPEAKCSARAGRYRSVFNTPTAFTHFRPIFGLLFENVVGMLTGHSFLHGGTLGFWGPEFLTLLRYECSVHLETCFELCEL